MKSILQVGHIKRQILKMNYEYFRYLRPYDHDPILKQYGVSSSFDLTNSTLNNNTYFWSGRKRELPQWVIDYHNKHYKFESFDKLIRPNISTVFWPPACEIVGGMLWFQFESQPDDGLDFIDWMKEGISKEGFVEIYTYKNQDQPIRFKFWDALCVSYQEDFQTGSRPMITTVCISLGILQNRDAPHFNKPWKVTEFNDEPLARDEAVDEARVLDIYFEDNNGVRIEDPKPNQNIKLIIHTQEMIGEHIDVDLSDDDIDYEFNGELLQNDMLRNVLVEDDQM